MLSYLKTRVLWIILIIGVDCKGQDKLIDSLKRVFYSTKTSSEKLDASLLLFKHLYSNNPDSGMKYFNYAKSTQTRTNDKKVKAHYYSVRAWLFNDNYIMDSAIIYCDSCLSLCAGKVMEMRRAECLHTKGIAYFYKGEREQAAYNFKQSAPIFLKYGKRSKALNSYNNLMAIYLEEDDEENFEASFKKAIELADTTKDFSSLANVYINVAAFNDRSQNYQKAIEASFRSLMYTEKAGKEDPGLYSYIGTLFMNLNNYDKAIGYLKKGHALAFKINDANEILKTTGNISLYYQNLNRFKEALLLTDSALKYCDEENLPAGTAMLYKSMTWSYSELGNYNKAALYADKMLFLLTKSGNKSGIAEAIDYKAHIFYKQKKYKEAIRLMLEGLNIAREANNKIYIKNFYQSLARAYSESGDHKNATPYFQKYIQIQDSLTGGRASLINSELEEKYQSVKKENEILTLSKETKVRSEQLKNKALELEKSTQQKTFLIIGLILTIGLLGFVAYSFIQKQKANKIISAQKLEVEAQKHLIEEKQHEILDSITYAKRLQEAILPPRELVNRYLPDNFILYKPKDIVAGDFYWMESISPSIGEGNREGEVVLIAAADSTGHGVPGAMVSVVCSNAMNRAVKEFGLTKTGEVLDKTRELVLETFARSNEEVKDGMDVSLLSIDKANNKISWSGANNPLWYVQNTNGENPVLREIKANKQPIGKSDYPTPYNTHEIAHVPGTIYYLMTDGYPDQFGGEKGKKFKYKQLEELLISIYNLSMPEQSMILDRKFEDWKGTLEQVDDVSIIGIRIN